jgi:hypothetical protein
MVSEVVMCFLLTRAIERISSGLLATFLSVKVNCGMTVLGLMISTLVCVFSRTNRALNIFLTADSNRQSLNFVTEILVSVLFAWTIKGISSGLLATFLAIKVNCGMTVLSLSITTLMFVLSGTNRAWNIFLTADSNRQSLDIVSEILVSVLFTWTIERISSGLLATFLAIKVNRGMTVLSLSITTFVRVFAGTNSTWNIFLTADSNR